MTDKQEAKQRTQMLKQLREAHSDTVTRTKALLKEQNAIRKQLRSAMADGPQTVPQIAQAAGLPSDQVLWHLTAMKKYDLVVETGMDGEYFQYRLSSEKEK